MGQDKSTSIAVFEIKITSGYCIGKYSLLNSHILCIEKYALLAILRLDGRSGFKKRQFFFLIEKYSAIFNT